MYSEYLRSLAYEYLALIAEMQNPDHDADARQRLSADRTNVHNELIRLLGSDYERPFDMAAHCRELIRQEAK